MEAAPGLWAVSGFPAKGEEEDPATGTPLLLGTNVREPEPGQRPEKGIPITRSISSFTYS